MFWVNDKKVSRAVLAWFTSVIIFIGHLWFGAQAYIFGNCVICKSYSPTGVVIESIDHCLQLSADYRVQEGYIVESLVTQISNIRRIPPNQRYIAASIFSLDEFYCFYIFCVMSTLF